MPETRRGYDRSEVVSALQKAIRRSSLTQACWWAAELDQSGFGRSLWRRLEVICSEDIGPAWPEGPAVISALKAQWEREIERKSKTGRLYVMHAVAALVEAPKSRVVDHALWACYGTDEALEEIPDWALDMHTRRGRAMGRETAEHFEFEAAKLVQPDDERLLDAQKVLYERYLEAGYSSAGAKAYAKNTWPAPPGLGREVFIDAARGRKVKNLLEAAAGDQPPTLDWTPEAWANPKGWSDEQWQALAKTCGVNKPSPTTIGLVRKALEK